MAVTSDPRRRASYGLGAKLFHWVTVVLVAAQFAIMAAIPEGAAAAAPEVEWMWALHASIGVTILVLTLLRAANRLISPPPPLPAGTPAIERLAAGAVHLALYLALIAMPSLGWLTLNAYSGPFTVFGLIELPALVGIDPSLKSLFGRLHATLAMVVLLLVAMHVAAALFHGIVRRDGVLGSMLR